MDLKSIDRVPVVMTNDGTINFKDLVIRHNSDTGITNVEIDGVEYGNRCTGVSFTHDECGMRCGLTKHLILTPNMQGFGSKISVAVDIDTDAAMEKLDELVSATELFMHRKVNEIEALMDIAAKYPILVQDIDFTKLVGAVYN